MVFSESLYPLFTDSNGNPYTTVVSTTIQSWKGQSMNIQKIVTPKVIGAVQSHYGCNTADGGELEEYGGAGSAGVHWEKRITNNEYMISTASQDDPGGKFSYNKFRWCINKPNVIGII